MFCNKKKFYIWIGKQAPVITAWNIAICANYDPPINDIQTFEIAGEPQLLQHVSLRRC